jgi:hypothetical protein
VAGPQDLNRNGLYFCGPGRFVLFVSNRHNRYNNFLKHGPAMDEPGPSHEMKSIGSFWKPEFHTAFSLGGDSRCAMPDNVVIPTIRPKEKALLGLYGLRGRVIKAALVVSPGGLPSSVKRGTAQIPPLGIL